ncbi:unnamed protein product [Schistosoma margrebowiei]|uniref:Uncharacterized protein n=1 Tax=Schistosoma margrebowiei TaxID=48269 RepID=A0A3P7YNR8_9TREM|nr:unnamed protein product [Schistosoma margrebowiei]
MLIQITGLVISCFDESNTFFPQLLEDQFFVAFHYSWSLWTETFPIVAFHS